MGARTFAVATVFAASIASACGVPDLGYATSGSGGASSSSSSGAPACTAEQKACGATCVAKSDPAYGCAAPGCTPCNLPGATGKCDASGACVVASCLPGLVACGAPTDGCVDTTSTADDCGACGHACSAEHVASRACSAAACTSTCALGFANCNLPMNGADDGCETDVSSDPQHCGDCTVACGGTRTCVGSACFCASDADCSNSNASGTCDQKTHLCACSGTACVAGEQCAKKNGASTCACNGKGTCAATATCCPAGCRDLSKNAQNCGACGHACPKGFACKAGVCACNGANDCKAGTSAAFECAQSGLCVCEGKLCAPGQRCQLHGECG